MKAKKVSKSCNGTDSKNVDIPLDLSSPAVNLPRRRRGNLNKGSVQIMRDWAIKHLTNPYPSGQEKRDLVLRTNLTLTQVNNWFINGRRRKIQDMLIQAGQDPNNFIFSRRRTKATKARKSLSGAQPSTSTIDQNSIQMSSVGPESALSSQQSNLDRPSVIHHTTATTKNDNTLNLNSTNAGQIPEHQQALDREIREIAFSVASLVTYGHVPMDLSNLLTLVFAADAVEKREKKR